MDGWLAGWIVDSMANKVGGREGRWRVRDEEGEGDSDRGVEGERKRGREAER